MKSFKHHSLFESVNFNPAKIIKYPPYFDDHKFSLSSYEFLNPVILIPEPISYLKNALRYEFIT